MSRERRHDTGGEMAASTEPNSRDDTAFAQTKKPGADGAIPTPSSESPRDKTHRLVNSLAVESLDPPESKMAFIPNQQPPQGGQPGFPQQMQALNHIPAFDITRENVLSWSLVPIPFARNSSRANHASAYRLRWDELRLWDTFSQEVTDYWQRVPQADKTAWVFTLASYHTIGNRVMRTQFPPTNEGDIKDRQSHFVPDIHNYAAVGEGYAPRPLDMHSSMEHINPGGHTNLTVDGSPDFVFSRTRNTAAFQAWDPFTVLGEVKCPWLVTPAQIDQVLGTIDPAAPAITGEHPGRLALEQLYGYMVRNGCPFGVLSTFKGWCFLQRYSGGILRMTPMYGDFFARLGVTNGAADEGYHVPVNFSIMKALYYLSYVADAMPKILETPRDGVPGQVELPPSSTNTAVAASRIIQPPQPNQGQMAGGNPYGQVPGGYQGASGVKVIGGYENAVSHQYDPHRTYTSLRFEPWLKANCLGPKTWIARTLPDDEKIVLKIWDAWTCSSDDQAREASVYLKLRPLWGKVVPALHVQSPLEFYHALIIQYIEGSQLSHSNFTPAIGRRVREAYDAIHRYGVIQGDVGAHNVLISPDGQHVWIIDFEAGMILDGEARDESIKWERAGVNNMLEDLRTGKHSQYVFETSADMCRR